jgi:5-amino-6-(5-phosphoribosylamino)uracil reductase
VNVAIVCASSLDGKISTAARDSVTFTSRADRAHLHALRDGADAILIGAGTVRTEDPLPLLPNAESQAARVAAGRRPFPVRAVVSRSLDLPDGRALAIQDDAPVVVFTREDADPEKRAACEARGWEVVPTADLAAALAHLASAHGVEDLNCEGGGVLNAAMLAEDLVDAVHLTLCPLVLGGATAPTLVDGPGFGLGTQRTARLVSWREQDGELFLSYSLRE